jgi:tetratricopeptide (TPR) repeat protein
MPRWLSSRRLRSAGAAALVLALVVFVVRPVGSMAWNAAARDDLAAGNDAAAVDAFRIAGVFDPLDIDSRAALSNIDLGNGDIDGAIAHTRDHAARTPRTGAIAVRLGELEWLRGDPDAAERYFRIGIEQDEWQLLNADPYTPLGLLLITRGEIEEGKAMIAAGLRVSPVNARDPAWVAAGDDGMALDGVYAPGAALSEGSPLRRALERRLHLPAGGAASQPGDITLAEVIDITEAAAREEHDRSRAAEILHQAGLAFQVAGEHAQAARVLVDAREADPDASYVRYDLAQSQIALGDDAAAQPELEEVVRLARASDTYDLRIGFAQRDLALIAMRRGRYEDAIALMRAALDDYRWAYLPLANETIAEAYERLGDGERAAKWRQREAFLQGRD